MFAEPVDMYGPGAEAVPWTGCRSTRAEVAEFFGMLGDYLERRSFELLQLIIQGLDGMALGSTSLVLVVGCDVAECRRAAG